MKTITVFEKLMNMKIFARRSAQH